MRRVNPLVWVFLGVLVTVGALVGLQSTYFSRVITLKTKQELAGVRVITDQDNRTYRIHDDWLTMSLHSDKTWNTLQIGHEFRIEGYGLNVPHVGVYPLVLKADKVDGYVELF